MKTTTWLLCLMCVQSRAWAQLTSYTGPYGVGVIDVEVPVSQRRNITQATLKNGQPAFELDTVLFALFYPTALNATPVNYTYQWVPQPADLVARGFATFANNSGSAYPSQLIENGIKVLANQLYIPAQVDAPILSGNNSFPLIIWSHGDASTRTFYSHYLGELVSRGAIVAAIEHRDGSSPGSQILSVYNKQVALVRNVTLFGASDVSPAMSNEQFKFAQRAFRQAEVEATYSTLKTILRGGGQDVANNNARLMGATLADWNQHVYDNNVLIVGGHSFGATLVTQLLEPNATAAVPATAAIALDPGKDSGPLFTNVTVPILIMDSQSWSSQPTQFYGRSHFDVVASIANASNSNGKAGWFMTLLGSSHATVTDAGLISPQIVSFFDTGFNATINSSTGIDQYMKVSEQFLTFVKNGTLGSNLAVNVTDYPFNVPVNPPVGNNAIPATVAQYWQIHVSPLNSNSSNLNATIGSSNSTSTSGTKPSAAPVLHNSAFLGVCAVLIAIICQCYL